MLCSEFFFVICPILSEVTEILRNLPALRNLIPLNDIALLKMSPFNRWFLKKDFGTQHETGYDLGPGTLCCSACTWANISPQAIKYKETIRD